MVGGGVAVFALRWPEHRGESTPLHRTVVFLDMPGKCATSNRTRFPCFPHQRQGHNDPYLTGVVIIARQAYFCQHCFFQSSNHRAMRVHADIAPILHPLKRDALYRIIGESYRILHRPSPCGHAENPPAGSGKPFSFAEHRSCMEKLHIAHLCNALYPLYGNPDTRKGRITARCKHNAHRIPITPREWRERAKRTRGSGKQDLVHIVLKKHRVHRHLRVAKTRVHLKRHWPLVGGHLHPRIETSGKRSSARRERTKERGPYPPPYPRAHLCFVCVRERGNRPHPPRTQTKHRCA